MLKIIVEDLIYRNSFTLSCRLGMDIFLLLYLLVMRTPVVSFCLGLL